jgi:hypothetical protein
MTCEGVCELLDGVCEIMSIVGLYI